MKKRHKLSTLIVAALLVALLTGAAFAAAELRIFDSLFSKTASPEAAGLVQTDLGANKNNTVLLNVEEAVYDGKTVGLVLNASPATPDRDAVLFGVWMLQENLEEEYNLVYTETGPASGRYALEGRKDEKDIYTFSPVFKVNGEEVADRISETAIGLEDGSLRVWLQFNLPNDAAQESIACTVGARIGHFKTETTSNIPEIPFTLSKKANEVTCRLTPVSGNDHARVKITDAYATFSSLMGYFEIEYDYTPAPNESMGIDFLVFREDGTRLDTDNGEQAYLGDGKYLLHLETETLSSVPEFLILKAKVISEDSILTQVKCRLSKEADVRLPSSLPESAEEKKPIGLVLTPYGSWQGEKFRLLEGCIREGRSLYIAFTYDGNPRDIMNLKVLYKDQAGEIFAESITSACVVKDGYFTLTETLDGSMWPYPMTLEFTMNGKTGDTFSCLSERLIAREGQTGDSAFTAYALPAKVNEDLVFIREGDTFYHTRPGCGEGDASVPAKLSEASKENRTACPLCCEK